MTSQTAKRILEALENMSSPLIVSIFKIHFHCKAVLRHFKVEESVLETNASPQPSTSETSCYASKNALLLAHRPVSLLDKISFLQL